MFKKNSLFIVLLLFVFSFSMVEAQETWSLEECIDYAIKNSPTLAQSEFNLDLAELDLKDSKRRRLPSIDGNVFVGEQFGRFVDPTTNSFVNARTTFNSINLNGDIPLFTGGQIKNDIAQQKQLVSSAKWTFEEQINQLKLDVTRTFLAASLAQDQLEVSRINLNSLEVQLRNTKKQVEAGTMSVTDRLEIEAQIASTRQTIIQSQYQLDLSKLDLKNILNLPSNEVIEIERTDQDDLQELNVDMQDHVDKALQSYPSMLANEANLKASEFEIKSVRGSFLPSISLSGSVNTNYSSNGTRVVGFEDIFFEEEVTIMGEPSVIRFADERSIRESNPYFSQLNENLGQRVNLSMFVPIFNRGLGQVSLQRAKVNLLRAKNDYDNNKRQLAYNVQQSVMDMNASWQNYLASVESVRASERLLENRQREYSLGVINQVDYFLTRNRLITARLQLIRAKYDYIFKTKVVELYGNVN
ncbi:MAG: TolC family protein [Bacteroidota bacterium]